MAAGKGDGPKEGREQLDEQRREHLARRLDAGRGDAGQRGQRGSAGVERGVSAARVVLLGCSGQALAQFGGVAGSVQLGGQREHAGVCAGHGGAGAAATAWGRGFAAGEACCGACASGCGCRQCVGHSRQRASPQSVELPLQCCGVVAGADAGRALFTSPASGAGKEGGVPVDDDDQKAAPQRSADHAAADGGQHVRADRRGKREAGVDRRFRAGRTAVERRHGGRSETDGADAHGRGKHDGVDAAGHAALPACSPKMRPPLLTV